MKEEKNCLIWDVVEEAWWCEPGEGYTTDIDEVGEFSRKTAERERDTDPSHVLIIFEAPRKVTAEPEVESYSCEVTLGPGNYGFTWHKMGMPLGNASDLYGFLGIEYKEFSGQLFVTPILINSEGEYIMGVHTNHISTAKPATPIRVWFRKET